MRIGIVGSRRRKDKDSIYDLVDSLNKDDIVVSGGCKGVDTWAEERAKELGLITYIYRPNLKDIKHRGDLIQRYYDRNKKIAEKCDILYAFVSDDRTGGTENTIKHALKLKKKVIFKSKTKCEICGEKVPRQVEACMQCIWKMIGRVASQ